MADMLAHARAWDHASPASVPGIPEGRAFYVDRAPYPNAARMVVEYGHYLAAKPGCWDLISNAPVVVFEGDDAEALHAEARQRLKGYYDKLPEESGRHGCAEGECAAEHNAQGTS